MTSEHSTMEVAHVSLLEQHPGLSDDQSPISNPRAHRTTFTRSMSLPMPMPSVAPLSTSM